MRCDARLSIGGFGGRGWKTQDIQRPADGHGRDSHDDACGSGSMPCRLEAPVEGIWKVMPRADPPAASPKRASCDIPGFVSANLQRLKGALLPCRKHGSRTETTPATASSGQQGQANSPGRSVIIVSLLGRSSGFSQDWLEPAHSLLEYSRLRGQVRVSRCSQDLVKCEPLGKTWWSAHLPRRSGGGPSVTSSTERRNIGVIRMSRSWIT